MVSIRFRVWKSFRSSRAASILFSLVAMGVHPTLDCKHASLFGIQETRGFKYLGIIGRRNLRLAEPKSRFFVPIRKNGPVHPKEIHWNYNDEVVMPDSCRSPNQEEAHSHRTIRDTAFEIRCAY